MSILCNAALISCFFLCHENGKHNMFSRISIGFRLEVSCTWMGLYQPSTVCLFAAFVTFFVLRLSGSPTVASAFWFHAYFFKTIRMEEIGLYSPSDLIEKGVKKISDTGLKKWNAVTASWACLMMYFSLQEFPVPFRLVHPVNEPLFPDDAKANWLVYPSQSLL